MGWARAPAKNSASAAKRSLVLGLGNEILGQLPMLAASTGSACHAGSLHMSPVLDAMGVASAIGLGAIRFSLGRNTTMAEVEWVLGSLKQQFKQK